ncbi:PLANT INVERTASE/PECTIN METHYLESTERASE INHIBITOR SUPERFAMILY PROTEIN [Salix koriyanagi]|uniref:PLANT INVERTASE/PECTIN METHYLESTERASE INHIBITOR SUPERFAMILY PROTEIN n=1 Tax=Salix koriyanagi TaxID=2511006 RepID=A0A9Q0WC70_9ROSI|nr:PLANT INVERTASE/PECTIN METHYLESTERASE INHIBITOR SUPERFAMILY PROTEIN [Salix koriyanagi]
MAKSSFVSLILSILYIASTATSASTTGSSASAANFIKASCTATTYPALCVQSLSLYATSINQSPRQLIQTALAVSLDKAQSTKTFVYKLTRFNGVQPREKAAIKDCFEEIDDTVDRLAKSVKELKSMGSSKGKDFQWHTSNVQTWISAGLTDENTCVDGFAGKALNGRIKNSIKARFVHVERVTSNALALINKFGSKY